MRKYFIIICFLSFLTDAVFAQMPSIVRDRNKNNQLRSIEYMQWRFTPRWYYYNIWHRGGLLGLHQGYINKYNRNITQYAPTMVTTSIAKEDAQKQEEETSTYYNQEVAKFADRTIDYQYELTNPRRNELYSAINRNLAEYLSKGGKTEHAEILTDEMARIRANVDIMHDSHISNAKKREAYVDFEKELVNVYRMSVRLRDFNNRLNIYSPVEKSTAGGGTTTDKGTTTTTMGELLKRKWKNFFN